MLPNGYNRRRRYTIEYNVLDDDKIDVDLTRYLTKLDPLTPEIGYDDNAIITNKASEKDVSLKKA